MTDHERDMIDRLREMAGPIKPNFFTQVADEIERLRAGGCARDQKTTQYCAEAMRLQVEIERLRGELASTTCRLTEERDEARRMWCEAEHLGNSISADAMDRRARAEAKRRGWDCFKEAAS